PSPNPLLLPYHVVPRNLSFSDLLLPRRARLSTLLVTKTISVTNNSPANFSLDHTPLTHPDLFFTPSLAVHSVQSFRAFSSDSRFNGVVLLPFFSFVLPLLLCQDFSISFEKERRKRTFGLHICFSSTTVATAFNGDGDKK
ncbi:hypothetical protein V8G54_011465, partial [Vigna mungo]